MNSLAIYEQSKVTQDRTTYALTLPDHQGKKYLVVSGDSSGFNGTYSEDKQVILCPPDAVNAAQLRQRLPWLTPRPLGLATSVGFGDRLGIATPGHAQAVKGTGIAPIFAQQSVRENTRTHRTPQQVLDDAMWGLFEVGWREAWGADADHLKTTADMDRFIAAGYTFFTIDPGEYVDDAAETDDLATLQKKISELDWNTLESSPDLLRQQYLQDFSIGHLSISFDEQTLLKAATKYGQAVAYTVKMARHLQVQLPTFDLEMSVDETATPTSFAEHFYIVSELKRLAVPVISLAPRFVGRFEKGVDYIGDLAALEANLAGHAALQRYFGSSYKISLHSGSDKFSVYPLAARHAAGLIHLKTAGTSYLEALRVLAVKELTFFRGLMLFACDRYATDRQTYHVSAQLEHLPSLRDLTDDKLPDLLDRFDARQILHVTFGSVLDQCGEQFHTRLRQHEQAYHVGLRIHFEKHLIPFMSF